MLRNFHLEIALGRTIFMVNFVYFVRVSTLALALSKKQRPSYKLYNFAIVPENYQPPSGQWIQEEPSYPHFYRSQNLNSTQLRGLNINKTHEGSGLTRSPAVEIASNNNFFNNAFPERRSSSRLASSWSSFTDKTDTTNQYSRTPPLGSSAEGSSRLASDCVVGCLVFLCLYH